MYLSGEAVGIDENIGRYWGLRIIQVRPFGWHSFVSEVLWMDGVILGEALQIECIFLAIGLGCEEGLIKSLSRKKTLT